VWRRGRGERINEDPLMMRKNMLRVRCIGDGRYREVDSFTGILMT
jgi:hypothetical protein